MVTYLTKWSWKERPNLLLDRFTKAIYPNHNQSSPSPFCSWQSLLECLQTEYFWSLLCSTLSQNFFSASVSYLTGMEPRVGVYGNCNFYWKTWKHWLLTKDLMMNDETLPRCFGEPDSFMLLWMIHTRWIFCCAKYIIGDRFFNLWK